MSKLKKALEKARQAREDGSIDVSGAINRDAGEAAVQAEVIPQAQGHIEPQTDVQSPGIELAAQVEQPPSTPQPPVRTEVQPPAGTEARAAGSPADRSQGQAVSPKAVEDMEPQEAARQPVQEKEPVPPPKPTVQTAATKTEARPAGPGYVEAPRAEPRASTREHVLPPAQQTAPPPARAKEAVARRTRVVKADPEVLRRNKILSIFHGEELSDQIKILSAQILNKMEQTGGNSLLVTSARLGEGKTFTALNLALSICLKVDRTVLLVDADLRRPDIHRHLGIDATRGLSDYLLNQAEIPELLINPGIEKMTILPGGRPLANSTEMLGSPRMQHLVREMKKRYPDRFIIFDSSALLLRADPLVFSNYIDSVLLVVEAEQTSSRDVRKAFELLERKPVIGVVLNKMK